MGKTVKKVGRTLEKGLKIGADVATGGAVSRRDAAKEQEKSQKLAQRRADIATARQRRQQIRDARIARAQVASQGSGRGIQESSGIIGAEGSIGSQLSSNLSFLDRTQEISGQISQANIRAGKLQSRAATFQAVKDTAESFAPK